MDNYPSKQLKPKGGSFLSPGLETVLAILIVLGVGFLLLAPIIIRDHPHGSVVHSEMRNLEAAILQYQAVYGRPPVSREKQNINATKDFTFGTYATGMKGINITNSIAAQANNSDVMAVLMDMESFINGPTVNSNHLLNPGKHVFFSPSKVLGGTNLPGLGPDGVLRDPWGNPYIISIDTNNDGNCRDALYQMASVSEMGSAKQEGLKGLSRPTIPPYNSDTRDTFQIHRSVMIWSMGPDGKADVSKKADEGVNKDNILSWN